MSDVALFWIYDNRPDQEAAFASGSEVISALSSIRMHRTDAGHAGRRHGMTGSGLKPGGNIFEAACDSIAAVVLAMAVIKDMPLAEGDGIAIAEALVDRLELTDVHALVERDRHILDALIKRADACLDQLRPLLGAMQAAQASGQPDEGAPLDKRLRDLIEDVLAELPPAR